MSKHTDDTADATDDQAFAAEVEVDVDTVDRDQVVAWIEAGMLDGNQGRALLGNGDADPAAPVVE